MTAQRELSPLGLYSHGAETSMALPQAKGTPEQFASMLERQGVKPVELEGFIEKFSDRPSITREEAAEYFTSNAPQTFDRVYVKRDAQPYPEEYREIENRIYDEYQPELQRLMTRAFDESLTPLERDQAFNQHNAVGEEIRLRIDEAIPNRRELLEAARPTAETQFHSYTLPNSQNYREVVIKAPIPSMRPATALEKRRGYASNAFGETSIIDENGMVEAVERAYRHTHWPQDQNVLAHMRLADRIGPNGEKILHVEEIQSDWAQTAQRQRVNEIKRIANEKNIDPEEAAKLVPQDFAFNRNTPRRDELIKKIQDAQKNLDNYQPDPQKLVKAQQNYDEALAARDAFVNNFDYQKAYEVVSKNYMDNGNGVLQPEKFNEILQAFKNDKLQMSEAFFPQEFRPLKENLATATSDFNALRMYDPAKLELQRNLRHAQDELDIFTRHLEENPPLPRNSYIANTSAWTDLSLKRIMKEAADGGYDRVVFTPGMQQAERWSQVKDIDTIHYVPSNQKGKFNIETRKDGENVSNKYNITAKEIEKMFGKDITDQIVKGAGDLDYSTGYNTISNVPMKIGGEGMKGYYDKIVPTQLAKLLKKVDGKLGKHEIPNSGARPYSPPLNSVDLVDWHPETRHLSDPEKNAWLESKTPAEKRKLWEEYLDANGNALSPNIQTYGFDLTPEMRETISRGFPHYAHGGEVDKRPFIPMPNKYKPIVDRALMLTSKKA
jgi:hypothetical protein